MQNPTQGLSLSSQILWPPYFSFQKFMTPVFLGLILRRKHIMLPYDIMLKDGNLQNLTEAGLLGPNVLYCRFIPLKSYFWTFSMKSYWPDKKAKREILRHKGDLRRKICNCIIKACPKYKFYFKMITIKYEIFLSNFFIHVFALWWAQPERSRRGF